MDDEPTDDMMFLCAGDGSLALTGREQREREHNPRQQSVSPIESAGRVLHAWDITDRSGDPIYREYTTTQGYLVSEGEVVSDGRAFVSVDPQFDILSPNGIKARVQEATEETEFGGLKKSYSSDELKILVEKAEQISEYVVDALSLSLSIHFTGVWEQTHPYLVGTDHQHRVPLKGENVAFRDTFVDVLSTNEEFSNRQIKLLWEAVSPELVVDLELYVDGELVL